MAVTATVLIARTVVGCHPPSDQVDLIEQFTADPVFAAAPANGQLVEERFTPQACDDIHGTAGPDPAQVSRLYRTPTVYSLDELRQRFDQPAAAGGWSIEEDEAQTHPGTPAFGGFAIVTYCKQAGRRISYAFAQSSEQVATNPETVPVVGIRVVLYAGPDGRKCGVDDRVFDGTADEYL